MSDRKRTRLSPEQRKNQLLDCARSIIESKGLSSFTMEALARAAGVSNPLVYKYFGTRLQILQELLERDSKEFNLQLKQQVEQASDYQELVTIIVSANFVQFSSSNIVNILREQPDVFETIADQDRKQHRSTARFLVKSMASQFTLETKQAEQLVVFASGASQAAAAHYNRYGGNRKEMIEDTVEFIFGGIHALTNKP